jgi:hypothetical protein
MFGALRKAKGRMQIGPFLDQSKYFLMQNGIHMSPADWDDPYLYGHYYGSTFALLKAGSEGRLQGVELADVQAYGWNVLTTLPEELFFARTERYLTSKIPEWLSGSDNGIAWALLMTGRVNVKEPSPKIAEALAAGRELGRLANFGEVPQLGADLQNAAAFLCSRDWVGYIKDKKAVAA